MLEFDELYQGRGGIEAFTTHMLNNDDIVTSIILGHALPDKESQVGSILCV